jgi:hypothetical protein
VDDLPALRFFGPAAFREFGKKWVWKGVHELEKKSGAFPTLPASGKRRRSGEKDYPG